jgi:hypothetical protein
MTIVRLLLVVLESVMYSFAFELLIGLIHADGLAIKVDVAAGQREQFTEPDTAPIEDFKRIEHSRRFHRLCCKLGVFIPRPKLHFVRVFLAHAPGFARRVCFQSIVFECVCEYRRHLVMDTFEIGILVRLSIVVAALNHDVLPANDVLRCDGIYRLVAEIRDELISDDVLLRKPCVYLSCGFLSSA